MLRQLLNALVVCGLLIAPLALSVPVSQASPLPAATETAAAPAAPSLLAPTACPTDLFFSEYIEGSSNNKALEIYNGTGADITFTNNYTVGLFSNGGTTAGNVAVLSGTLAAGDVYVIVNASANITISAQADLTSTVTFYNGDDALALYHNGAIIDAFGQIGFDPGAEWGTGLVSTLDNTLVRKSSITTGDLISNDVFSPTLEWDGYANDTFSFLGSHTMDSCQAVLEADLGLGKDGPATALASQNITYTLSLSNTGTAVATGTVITDTLPDEVTFVTYTTDISLTSFTRNGQALIWDLGDVPTTTVNATIGVQVFISPLNNGDLFTNTVTASTTYTEPNQANNADSVTTFIGSPNLAIVKTGPASANAGETFTYTLAYSNAGSIDATNATIVDQLPAGVTFITETTASVVPVNGQLTWPLGTLGASNGGSIDVVVTGDNAGNWINTATISGGPVDSDLLNNTSSVTTTVKGVDVYVAKSGPAVVFGGELISYTITYGNAGNITATATLTDQLPISFTVNDIAVDNSGLPFANGVWSPFEIAPNTEVSFTFVLTVPTTITSSTRITNSVIISAVEAGDDPVDNVASASSTVLQFTSIHDIQYVNDPDVSDTSTYSGTWVAVEGVVIANPSSFLSAGGLPYRYYIEDPAGGPWSGLYIYRGTANPPGVHEGDFVRLYGWLTEFVQGGSQQTELDLSKAGAFQQILSSNNPLPAPAVLTTDQLINAGSAEPWESVLIEFQNARVTNPNISNGEWNFDDGNGAAIGDDNAKAGSNTVFTYVPQLNDHYAFIRGIGWQSFATYKIEPRYNADVQLDYPVTFTYTDLEDVVQVGEEVELRGDFTNWETNPITLSHDAGYTTFSATVTLPTTATQAYKYYVAANGGGSWDWLNNTNVNRVITPTRGVLAQNDYRRVFIGWANLQWPPTITLNLGEATPDIYGRLYAQNVTNATGAGRSLATEVGYGTTANPVNWSWASMVFNAKDGVNNDEYRGVFTPTASGVYSYATRYNANWGAGNPNSLWTYASLNGVPFSLDQTGVLTVTVPQLAFAKSIATSASAMQLGDVVTYTLELSNSGDGAASGVLITDVLPAEVTFGGFVQQNGAAQTNGTVTWGGTLNAGLTTSVVFTATVGNQRAFYGRTVTNTAQFTSSNGGSNSAEAVFQIVKRYFIFAPLVRR